MSGGTTSNVWNAAANGSGAWMDISVLTAGGDTVLAANAQTAILVNITIDLGTGRLSTAAEGGTAGGGFTFSGAAARSITADISAGTTHCLACTHTGTGANKLTIIGDITGGAANGAAAMGLRNTSSGEVAVTGNITGGTGTGEVGAYNSSTGPWTITGDITGGTGYNSHGFHNAGSGAIAVTGNCSGAPSGVGGQGLVNFSAGAGVATCTVVGNLINTLISAAVYGVVIWNPGSGNYIAYPKTSGGAGTWYYAFSNAAADVRSGTLPTDGTTVGNASGTLAVPAAAAVLEAEPVDAGVGTYHEATAAEVQSGVTFGPSSTYTGTYAGGGIFMPTARQVGI